MTMFSKEGGWPYDEVKNTDEIVEMEKRIEEPNPVPSVSGNSSRRLWLRSEHSHPANILLAEQGKAQYVATFNVAVPMICKYSFVETPLCGSKAQLIVGQTEEAMASGESHL